MPKPKSIKIPRVNWRVYALFLASFMLAVVAFFPDKVNFSRDILMLLGVIVVLALWPTLKSGKIPYIMEIKKKGR